MKHRYSPSPCALCLLLPAFVACGSPDEGNDDGGPTPPRPTNYIIVTADALGEAAAEVAAHREAKGFRVATHLTSDLVVDPDDGPALLAAVRAELQIAYDELPADEPLYLLLLGDAGVAAPLPNLPCIEVTECATIYVDEGPLSCCSDNPYGDLDGDRIPEVAVGRLPAHIPQEVSDYLAKLEEHESTYEPGLWNRRISLFTGEAGFGEEIDALIEAVAMSGLKEVDHAFDIIGTYDNPSSVYFYTPMLDKVLELFNEGAIMVVYIGHGSKTSTQSFGLGDLSAIECRHRRPFAFFYACLNGIFTGPTDSLAEAMLRAADGPVTTFAAAELSHPYGNAVLAFESQRALMENRFATIGEAILFMKRESISNDDNFRQTIDLGGLVSGETMERLEQMRYEHLTLYNLFGDPAAAIPYPRHQVEFDPPADGSLAAGQIKVNAHVDGMTSGTALVTLEVDRDVILGEPEPINEGNPHAATVQANWSQAMNKAVAATSVDIVDGEISANLTFDPDLPESAYFIKVYAQDETTDGFGYLLLE